MICRRWLWNGQKPSKAARRWEFAPAPQWPFYCYKPMEIDLIFKIAAVGIIVSILNQVLSRSGRDEQATMTTLAGLVVVLMILAQRIADLFQLVKDLFEF